MSKLAKIVVTIIIVIVFSLLFSAISGMASDAGQETSGIFGLIVFAGLIGALRAVWKKPKNKADAEGKNSDVNKTDNNNEIKNR